MIKTIYTLPFLLFFCLLSCKEVVELPPEEIISKVDDFQVCSTPGCALGSVYFLGNQQYLSGGVSTTTHFNITDWSLDINLLNDYGYDRETIEALIDAPYGLASEIPGEYKDEEPVIVLQGKDRVKVYPYILMKYHEVINDVVDGEPVMIAYCFLADLAAVYSRTYCDKEFTFAVSGYTYGDEHIWDGKQGFVLWDRDTESLWWPLIDRGVSGVMKNTRLTKHTASAWSLSTWGEIKTDYPKALVLKSDPNWNPPLDFSQYACDDLSCCN
ncbi:DUF3179 domain-containing protein [bacterium]|nr:DUF3179 domain-containing protein [bacterium]